MPIPRKLQLSLLTILIGCAAAPAVAAADWHEPVGGPSPINFSPTSSADAANLAVIGGVPYVAWNEDTTQQGQGSSSTIHVAKLAADGQSWAGVGENGTTHPISLLQSTSSDNPWLADVGGTPWIAWQEGVSQQDTEIRVSQLVNGIWTEVPPTSTINHPINHDGHGGTPTDAGGNAGQPTLADDGTGHPYVSFSEFDPGSGSLLNPNNLNPGQVWVDQLNSTGDGWNEVGGGSANANPSADALFPRMTVINGTPWVVYWQIVPPNGGPPSVDINVAHLSADGQSWLQDGPVFSAAFGQNGPPVGAPSIASVGGTPYVTFTDKNGSNNEVLVYSFDGSNWNVVGGGPATDPNVDSESPSIADLNGSPWISWYTSNGAAQIEAAQLINGTWQRAGTTANDNPSHSANNGAALSPTGHSSPAPSLASVNGIPWIGFVEDDQTVPGNQNSPGCCKQVRVSRLEPTFLSTSAEPSSTSATLVTKLQTYGLPYPVGFQWGAGGNLTHTTALKPASGDPAFSFTSIVGLKPSSLYSFMPVATAGTPKPLVDGPDGAFVTQAAQKPPPPAPLFTLILRMRGHVPPGHPVRIQYFVSDTSSVQIVVTHKKKVVDRFQARKGVGTHEFTVPGSDTKVLGGYTVTLTAHSGTRTARDQTGFRVTAPK